MKTNKQKKTVRKKKWLDPELEKIAIEKRPFALNTLIGSGGGDDGSLGYGDGDMEGEIMT